MDYFLLVLVVLVLDGVSAANGCTVGSAIVDIWLKIFWNHFAEVIIVIVIEISIQRIIRTRQRLIVLRNVMSVDVVSWIDHLRLISVLTNSAVVAESSITVIIFRCHLQNRD